MQTNWRISLGVGLVALAMAIPLAPASAPASASPARAFATKAKRHHAAPRCRRRRGHPCRKPRRRPPPPPPPPQVATGQAQGVSAAAATLTGTLAPHGGTPVYWFQYGPSSQYGEQTSQQAAGRGHLITVRSAVGGLVAGQTYHYRVIASSCDGCRSGTAAGGDATFIAGGYTNPVFGSDFGGPDPFVLDSGGAHDDYWAFSTGSLFPIVHSVDLVHWTPAGDALAARPAWVRPTGDWHPWGPSVAQVAEPCPGTGSTACYVLYYTGTNATGGMNCIGVATSTTPGGPYTDQGPLSDGSSDASGRPVGCGSDGGYGLIDPSPFRDPSGQAYLYVSEDHVCPIGSLSCTSANSRLRPTIEVIPLAANHLTATGPSVPLFSGDPGTWEAVGSYAPTVEGPAMVYRKGIYYLFYSGGNYHDAYGMGYATATSPTGPFTKSPANPVMSQTPTVFSPGGADAPVTGPHGGTWLVYHGREGSYLAPRLLRIEQLSWRNPGYGADVPVLGQPTDSPQAFAP